ncbi:MAG TPA: Flp pilus assembly protein CpaB [Polyangiales bacterium]|nr:Flp pilus assembly protein CpaB [Polyangiales bacterium]
MSAELGKTSRRALYLAALVGLVSVALLMLYLRRFEQEVAGGNKVAVLGLRKPIARGELITDDALTVFEVPLAYVERRSVKQVDRQKVVGVRAAAGLTAQDLLLWSDLVLSNDNRDLAALIQPGKRAVTVKANESGSDPAGNGLVHPGDYVDVVVTLKEDSETLTSVVLLQRVLVLAVGSETTALNQVDHTKNERHNAQRELTLSLKMEEVQLLTLAREKGRLSVALRSPSDAKVIDNMPDLALTSLYDKEVRETVVSRPIDSALPVRVVARKRENK